MERPYNFFAFESTPSKSKINAQQHEKQNTYHQFNFCLLPLDSCPHRR